MPTGQRTTDTFPEGLRKLLGNLTDLKTYDDVNMPFVINLETAVLQQLKQGASQALNPAGPTGGPGMGAPGAGPGVAPGMAPPGMAPPGMAPPGMAPPGMTGMMPGVGPGPVPAGPGMAPGGLPPAAVPGLAQGPNMDELRRALMQGTTASRLGSVAQRLSGL